MPIRNLLPGRPYPLGAKASSKGTNFALYSEHATKVFVCLFDENDKQTDCIELRERTAFVFHNTVVGIKAGQRYGYRVEGPFDPKNGFRFNSNKLLVDPYAKAITGVVDWNAPIFQYPVASGNDLEFDDQDSAAGVPKSVVIDDKFDWGDDCKPDTPLSDSVIYEVHVKGYSERNPMVPRSSAAPTPASPTSLPSTTSKSSASPRSNSSPSTISSMTAPSSAKASKTTGATTPSASSPPPAAIPRSATQATRSRNSRKWSRPSTPQA